MGEKERLEEDRLKSQHWRRWGSYLSERQWATVREDYSQNGDVWGYFTHDQARSRTYLWGEDGIGGISDNHQRLCFACTFWNGKDPILKERLFGLTGKEGNHGEDVKEYYYYLDNTPTHSYMHFLYKYPQKPFPYDELVKENAKRSLTQGEYELIDTGVFEKNRYFDIEIRYAKLAPDDLLIEIRAHNRGDSASTLHLLPTLWFRNTWSGGMHWEKGQTKPRIEVDEGSHLIATHPDLGARYLYFNEKPRELLFTENESNLERLFSQKNGSPFVKDAFHEYLISGKKEVVNPQKIGTKAALYYSAEIPAQGSYTWKLRLSDQIKLASPFSSFDQTVQTRKMEADAFYDSIAPSTITQEERQIQRQAFAGMLWNKQFYHYVVEDWLKRNPEHPQKPLKRDFARNQEWGHIYNDDILSVPDKWEYPCFFSWDSAFHTLPLAMIDPEFAKKQLMLLTREWYMHPNGQLPAAEWSFDDVNPPVHAWASFRTYKIEKRMHGRKDLLFLERVFQKLLLNFTWWVNRKDADGKNIFKGGFLGMDNISVFNRSEMIPQGGTLYQSDATSWMGMYCLSMLSIALELAEINRSYEDMASKFFEHFLYISEAINYKRDHRLPLWNEEDGFYYDLLTLPDGTNHPLKVRSMVGIIPLFAVTVLSSEQLKQFKGFNKRLEWFLNYRGDLCEKVASMRKPGREGRRLLSLLSEKQLRRILEKMLDEEEFLSPFGIRSLSKYHEKNSFVLGLAANRYTVDYEPAESSTKLFGGNSNWRGPIWFPLNMLIIESLQKFHYYFGDEYKVECPTRSGKMLTLWEVAGEISNRLVGMFLKDKNGQRAIYGQNSTFQKDPLWNDFLIFPEYFHGENGMGLGASHQTGWTGLLAKLIQQRGQYRK